MKFRSLALLALRGITGSAFRSWLIALCALVIAGFALSTVLVVRGSEDSLNLTLGRLGADILVVPQGAESQVQGALLMGSASKFWMPTADVAKIAAVRGVEAASPQLYLESLANAPCCAVSNMFMVAYDPTTDFTVGPWLDQKLGETLGLGEAIGGKDVFVPQEEQNLTLHGYPLTLRGRLEPTGTNLDNSIFVTFETAQDMARVSKTRAVQPLVIPTGGVSSVLVKVAAGADVTEVAADIIRSVPEVTPIQSPNMFGTFRSQISGVLRGMIIVLALALALSLLLIALLFSMAVAERRRQIGVLRAIGATRTAVVAWILTEAVGLALAGGVVGVVLSAVCIFLFRNLLARSLGFFIFPSAGVLAAFIVVGLVIAVACVALAAMIPALCISRQEPATSMRE